MITSFPHTPNGGGGGGGGGGDAEAIMAREEKIGCKWWKGGKEEDRRVELFSYWRENEERRKRAG